MADGYIKKLSGIIDGKSDVIGYAFAVNGKISSSDVYGSNALFRQLWPKLLKASAVEAIAELQKDAKFFALFTPSKARRKLSVLLLPAVWRTNSKPFFPPGKLFQTKISNLFLPKVSNF